MTIDLHVHIVGNGASGSGCWYRPRGWTKWGAPFMLRSVGLPAAALRRIWIPFTPDRLLSFVRSSSLDLRSSSWARTSRMILQAGSSKESGRSMSPTDMSWGWRPSIRSFAPESQFIRPGPTRSMSWSVPAGRRGALEMACQLHRISTGRTPAATPRFLERMAGRRSFRCWLIPAASTRSPSSTSAWPTPGFLSGRWRSALPASPPTAAPGAGSSTGIILMCSLSCSGDSRISMATTAPSMCQTDDFDGTLWAAAWKRPWRDAFSTAVTPRFRFSATSRSSGPPQPPGISVESERAESARTGLSAQAGHGLPGREFHPGGRADPPAGINFHYRLIGRHSP